MQTLPLFVFASVALLCLLPFFVGRKRPAPLPYERGRPLLSPAEHRFYLTLRDVVGDAGHVLFKVRLADVLSVSSGLDASSRQAALNQITCKHFDFVVCHKDTYEVIGCIELDDSSHNTARAKKSDAFKNAACASALVPLLRVTAAASYCEDDIRDAVWEVLGESAIDSRVKAWAS